MRRYKQGVFAKVDSEVRPVTQSPIITYKPQPWTSLNKYPQLENVFQDEDKEFVNSVLLNLKPYDAGPGYIYVYQRQSDVLKLQSGKITHILLHKIGLSIDPKKRILQ